MHNIKEGPRVKASVGDTFMDYAEAFKKTKRAQKEKEINIFANSKM